MSKPILWIVIPCYNEDKTIEKVVSDFKRVLPDAVIYVYDNNSTDDTEKLAKKAATAMLDPSGRKEVIRAARALNDVEKVTVILITHYMEEIIHADKVFVMDKGHIAMEGTPREIFSQVEQLQALRLDVPQVTLLAHELKQSGVPLPDGILTTEELVQALQGVK